MNNKILVWPAGKIFVTPGDLPAVVDFPGQPEGRDMLAAEVGGQFSATVFSVDHGIVVRVGCGSVKAFGNRTPDHDIDTIGCAVASVCKCAANTIKVDHQAVEVLIIGFSQHRPIAARENFKADTTVGDFFGLEIVRFVSGKIQKSGRLMKEPSSCKISNGFTRPPIDAEPGRRKAFICKTVPFEAHACAEIPIAALKYLFDVTGV